MWVHAPDIAECGLMLHIDGLKLQSEVWVGAPDREECGLVLQKEQSVDWCSRHSSVGWCSIQSVMWVSAPEWSVGWFSRQGVWDSAPDRVWVGAPDRVECGLVLHTDQCVDWCSRQSGMWVGAPDIAECGLVLKTGTCALLGSGR